MTKKLEIQVSGGAPISLKRSSMTVPAKSFEPIKGRSAFLELAEGLGLGVAARDKITISEVAVG